MFLSSKNFKLSVSEENGRYAGIGDVIVLRRTAKLKAREEDRTNLKPNVEASFPGLENLSIRLRNNRQSFSLSGDQVQSRGKALRIPITETWWMNIQLLIHEYVLTISSKQLNHLIEARNDFTTSGRSDSKGREHEDSAIPIQLALLNTNPNGNSIIIVDRIRLTIISHAAKPSRKRHYPQHGNNRLRPYGANQIEAMTSLTLCSL